MLGVAGMGMTPLAIYLAESGLEIVGFDDCMNPEVRTVLMNAGVLIEDYPRTDLLGFSEIVYSSAIRSTNSLLEWAIGNGVRALRRGDKMAEVCRGKRLIAVAGSHGKTTSTALMVHLLRRINFDCSWFIGGLPSIEEGGDRMAPGHYSKSSDYVIAEIDESDGTINGFSPEVLLLLNLDLDHSDHYESFENLYKTFGQLIQRTTQSVISHESCRKLVEEYTTQQSAVFYDSGKLNRSCALAVSDALFINRIAVQTTAEVITNMRFPLDSFDNFVGIRRRDQVLLDNNELMVIEDYAHHPREIDLFLRRFEKNSDLWIVFQPHRYSRTLELKEEFAEVFLPYENVILLPIYAASESPVEGGLDEDIERVFIQNGIQPNCIRTLDSLISFFESKIGENQPKQTILFLGAGDIEHWARAFVCQKQESTSIFLSSWANYIKTRISEETIIDHNVPIGNKTTFRVGGVARFYSEPANINDLKWIFQVSQLFGYPIFILGRGSNLIVSDKGFDGVVIRLNKGEWNRIDILEDGSFYAGAGVRLKELCGRACQLGMEGFEFLEGIPGSVGGSLRMNAGAMGNWIFDVVESVYYLEETGKIRIRSKKDFHVHYRKCEELLSGIALGAIFRPISQNESEKIRQKMFEFSHQRKSSQPKEPSAGCIFKNPEGGHAGKIVDELGLKGTRIGNAEVSMTHGNFIINHGNAKSDDVLSLIKQIRNQIYEKRGVLLEPEVLLLGQEWSEVL